MTRRTRIIGVIVGDVVDPYFAEITRGVEDFAGRAGYLTIVCNADRRPEVEREYLNLLRDYNAEGAVFAGSGLVDDDEELSATVEQARRRACTSSRSRPAASRAAASWSTTAPRPRDLVDYLVSLGHRTIGFVARAGRAALGARATRGLPRRAGEPFARARPLCEGDFGYASGHAAALDLLAGIACRTP